MLQRNTAKGAGSGDFARPRGADHMTNFAQGLTAATLLLVCAPASAQDDSDPIARRVAVGDLDLFTVAGRNTLDRRLERAARQVCPSEQPSLAIRTDQRCFTRTIAIARRQRDQLLASLGISADYRSASRAR